YQSFHRYGVSFDWSRRFNTSDPEYYRWTQWLFTKFHEKGLAYRKKSPVNWCPADQTVLANEQVVDGACERCGAEVTKRDLTQWYFKTTHYAQELLDSLDDLAPTWPSKVVNAQRNWIGRSEGAHVTFDVALDSGDVEPVTVFTTRPDTLWGATFMVVAADAKLAAELVSDEQRPALDDYVAAVRKASDIDRLATDRPKTGVFLGIHATNPVTGEQIPVWASDYVLADYGTGAIMAVPAHDQRDLDFALKFGLPVRTVIDVDGTDPAETGVATDGDGAYQNSALLDGLTDTAAGVARITEKLEADGTGQGAVQYRLRDWLLSRQRFWGCPIPIVHCPTCGEVPVPDDQLPVELPDLRGDQLAPKGTSPLAAATDWVATSCPQCGGDAQRDTDTMDTFVDSSWYFFRYCSPGYEDGPFDPADVARWMPVAQYVGGVEHAILHLLYMRFFSKVLFDMGMVDFTEPMLKLLNQGQVINQGKAMSKSLGNGVDLGEQIDNYGVDAVRLTMVFAGPPEDDIDWANLSPSSSLRFLQRAHRLAADVTSEPGVGYDAGDKALRKITHQMIAETSMLFEDGRFNVGVARTMELVNATRKAIDSGPGPADPAVREAAEFIAQALSLVAPYVAEEMWEILGGAPSVANSRWPESDPALAAEDTVTMVVQIQGKIRAKLEVSTDVTEEAALALAMADAGVQRSLDGREIVKVIARLPKMLSLVPGK
ncbi:MAG: leucine--tRNA ligase, partial [Propionibacterium sp.]|nr:leucine--tRNA ligase [Propionibacterium sp.]